MLAKQIDGLLQCIVRKLSGTFETTRPSCFDAAQDLHVQSAASSSKAFDDERWKPLSPKAGPISPSEVAELEFGGTNGFEAESSGFAEVAEKQWDILTEPRPHAGHS